MVYDELSLQALGVLESGTLCELLLFLEQYRIEERDSPRRMNIKNSRATYESTALPLNRILLTKYRSGVKSKVGCCNCSPPSEILILRSNLVAFRETEGRILDPISVSMRGLLDGNPGDSISEDPVPAYIPQPCLQNVNVPPPFLLLWP